MNLNQCEMYPPVTGMKKDRVAVKGIHQWQEGKYHSSWTKSPGQATAQFLSRQFCWQSCRFSSRTPWTIRFIPSALHTFPVLCSTHRMVGCLHFLIVFVSWLHLGFFCGCVEAEIAESRGPPGPSLPHPCGWDSPACNLWGWRLGMKTKRLQRSGESQITPDPGCPPKSPTSPW